MKKLFPILIIAIIVFSLAPLAYAFGPRVTPPATPTPVSNPATPVTTSPTPVSNPPTPVSNPPDQSSGGALVNPLKASSLTALISDLLGYVVELGAVFLTLMLIYVGFLFVAAQGNDEKLSKARSALVWTVVGGLILLGAQAISSAVAATVGALTS